MALLTIHGSKGLEFDLVFVLGLLRPSPEPELYVPAVEDNQRREPVSDAHDPRYIKYCEEIDAEKMRQTYVALTRAKQRVYIPVAIIGNRQDEAALGTASPMDLLLAKCQAPVMSYKELYQRIQAQDGEAFQAFLESTQAISWKTLTPDPSQIIAYKPSHTSVSKPPSAFAPNHTLKCIQSFTSLTLSHGKTGIENEQGAPHDFAATVKTAHTLPSGAETGVFLHKILEKIPFHNFKEEEAFPELKGFLKPFLENTPYETWAEPVASMIWTTLRTPLGSGQNSFCLVDLHPKKIYREADFLYLTPKKDFFSQVELSGISERRDRPIF